MVLSLGLELVEQTIGTIESPIIGIENKTITFNCTFTYPTDIPNPITINWTRAGIFVNESNPLYFINTIDSGDGVIRTFFTILALESFINFANPESPYRVVYNCEGVVGDMLSEKVKSDGIHIDVQCKNSHILYTLDGPSLLWTQWDCSKCPDSRKCPDSKGSTV